MPPIFFEASIRAALIAAAVAVVLAALRVRQAAVRHAAWTAVMAAMLLLPAWIAWGPKARLSWLPVDSWQRSPLERTAAPAVPLESKPEPERRSPAAAGRNARLDWATYAAALYLAGLAAMLLRLGMGTLRVRRLVRGAVLQDGKLTHEACVAPVTVGWLRPAMILPAGWRDWPPGRLRAVLAHEQEHVRRRDPLVQWMAHFNRALFWFHPLAWWLERELARLAEEACDEAALACSREPEEYAQHLLALARSVAGAGTRLNILGMAAAGSGLERRIRKICAGPPPHRASALRLACVLIACAVTVATLTTAWLAHAQPASPAFDVASIKPNQSGQQGGRSTLSGNSYVGTNVTLRRVIGIAYAPIQEFTGGPGWMESEHYDIAAKAEGNLSEAEIQSMLRSLLAERFKLVVHKETRDSPAYALMPARNDGKLGASLRRSDAVCTPSNEKRRSGCGFRVGDGVLAARGVTMENLAAELILVGRMVVDRTGLSGNFDIDLHWTPDEQGNNSDVLSSVREQLGLKLENARAPVEVIVIDSAARPSSN